VSDHDWAKEMAAIDKKLESVSDEALFPTSSSQTPERRAEVREMQKGTSTLGVLLRLLLSILLGVGILFWPYQARCGFGLAAYLAAVGVVVVSGAWSAVWSWRHRSGRAHSLSLLILLWGLVLAAMEVLPRTGYAKGDPTHPASWACK
jgi:hypothetical protein